MELNTAVKERPILMSPHSVQGIIAERKTQTRRTLNPQPRVGRSPDSFVRKINVGDWLVCQDLFPANDKQGWCLVECEAPGTYHYMGVEEFVRRHSPYGVPGERLWVKEPWIPVHWGSYEAVDRDRPMGPQYGWTPCIQYAADPANGWHKPWDSYEKKWRNAMYMPRWASRLTLEITDVRVERVQNISEKDAIAEGITSESIIVGANCDGGVHTEVHETRYFVEGGDEEGYKDPVDAYRVLWDSINGDRGGGIYSWVNNSWVWCISFKVVKP